VRSRAGRLVRSGPTPINTVATRSKGDVLVLDQVVKRDANGWPAAFWQLAGSEPEFSTGARPGHHERSDVLRRR
jgi:hypothetical protein